MSRPIDKRVTMKDVADAVGVHVSTVSRALDPKTSHRITAEVADQIRDACRELGYRESMPRPMQQPGRTRTVAIVVPDILDPVFAPIIHAAEQVLSERNILAVLANVDGRGQREETVAERLLARRVDGLMLVNGSWPPDVVSRLADDRVPIVALHRRARDPRVSTVIHDEEEGIRLVLEHLAALGHRRIAHLSGPLGRASGETRHRAFEVHRDRLGLDPSPRLIAIAAAYDEPSGERCAEALLDGRGITAIVCANDRLAIGALSALQRHGLDCPGDISVTGYNDALFADRVTPALTTIRTDQHRQGATAADILAGMMREGLQRLAPRHITLPVDLVVRDSTAAVATAAVGTAAVGTADAMD